MENADGLNSWRQIPEDGDLPDITVERLRRHFSQTYRLSEEQTDFMIKSSAQSLQAVFESARQIFESEVPDQAALIRMSHSLKGLLLNMGEPGWADIARSMEFAAKAGESRDYSVPVKAVRKATSAVMEYAQP
jgi:hypothetical protein